MSPRDQPEAEDAPKWGRCPQCGQTINADQGEETPMHQKPQGSLCNGGTAQ